VAPAAAREPRSGPRRWSLRPYAQAPGPRAGLDPGRLGHHATLLEIVDDRHGRASTVVTSQLPVAHWHEHIGNLTIADAVLDRLVHTAHRIELRGESLRKLRAAKAPRLDETAGS
jgi:hypothetical protein